MMLVSPVPVPCNQVVPAADLEAAVPALVEHALVAELAHPAYLVDHTGTRRLNAA
jgi:hypothetical protein